MWHTQEGLFRGKLVPAPTKELIEDSTPTPSVDWSKVPPFVEDYRVRFLSSKTVTLVEEPKDCA